MLTNILPSEPLKSTEVSILRVTFELGLWLGRIKLPFGKILNMPHSAVKVTGCSLKSKYAACVTNSCEWKQIWLYVCAGNWQMAGLLTFLDPPRPDTRETVERALAFGVDVKM